MSFWRFMGAVITVLLVVGWAGHYSPHYFVAVLLTCGTIGGLGSLMLFLARR